MKKELILGAAISAVLVSGPAVAAEKEKCYGVVKAGKNDCGAPGHPCAGQSSVDGAGKEWKLVSKGVCEKLVCGSLKPHAGKGPCEK